MWILYDPNDSNRIIQTSQQKMFIGDVEAKNGWHIVKLNDFNNLGGRATHLSPQANTPKSFPIQFMPSKVDSLMQSRDYKEGGVASIAYLSVGGLGDDLLKLNLLRQLVPKLRERFWSPFVTYVGRQYYDIFDKIDFVDRWEFVPKGVMQESISSHITERFDLVFDVRYTCQILKNGESWVGDPVAGVNLGDFSEEVIAKSFGDFSFYPDGETLERYLTQCRLSTFAKTKLSMFIRGREPFVVLATGTDPSIQKQTKSIPEELLQEIVSELDGMGIKSVQVGHRGVTYVHGRKTVNLIGQTSLRDLIWILRKSIGCITSEGGTAHLAHHTGVKSAVLFGPTDPDFWGYSGNLNLISDCNCKKRPCQFKYRQWNLQCADNPYAETPDCMKEFNAKDVVDKAVSYFIGSK